MLPLSMCVLPAHIPVLAVLSLKEKYGAVGEQLLGFAATIAVLAVGWWLLRLVHRIPVVARSLAPCERCAPQTWFRKAVVFIALAVLIDLGISTVIRAAYSPKPRTDLTVYQLAGQAVLDGKDIYQVHNVRGWNYVYLPLFAVVMVPFAKMTVFWGALTWYVLSVLMAASAAWMCVAMVRNCGPSPSDPFWLYALPPILLAGWFTSGMARGQASVLLLWLTVAGLYWQSKGKLFRGAAGLAGAIILKVFPAVLLGYFAWRKQWRFVAATLVALVVGLVLLPSAIFGWRGNWDYLREWTSLVANPSFQNKQGEPQNELYRQLQSPQKPRNQSLQAVLARVTNGVVGAKSVAALAVAMATVILVLARRSLPQDELLVLSTVMVWMLLVSPISESHYFVLLLLPMAMLVATAMTARWVALRRVTQSLLWFYGLGCLVSAYFSKIQGYGALCWFTVVLWGGFLVVLAMANMPRREETTGSAVHRL